MNKFVMLCSALLLAACTATTRAPQPGPVILASTSVLADIAQNIAGDRVQVVSLLAAGADPHSYQPVPDDLIHIEESTVLIVNGLEYEHFMEQLLENAGGERLIVTATDGIAPHKVAEDEHNSGDPHMWLDPLLVVRYVENIRAGLTEADPGGADTYQANADAYVAQLRELDSWITDEVAQIPPERRFLVTNHEALGYFADRYGFAIAGTVLRSASSAASPSAQELGAVIDEVRTTGAPAIFLDAVENPGFAQQIAAETGVVIVDDLHLESLTDGPPAATYFDMMRHNVTRIVEALR